MFVNVEIMPASHARLVIPGARCWIPVRARSCMSRRNGVYQMRVVTLGVRGETEVEVLKGIKKGERVVSSGNFLMTRRASCSSGSRFKSSFEF